MDLPNGNLSLFILIGLLSGTYGSSSANRTTILIYYESNFEDHLFVRGGISATAVCEDDLTADPCKIPIRTRLIGTTSTWDSYNYWRVNDNYLDWHGAEPDQGTYAAIPASGTPLAWTTNNLYSPNYQALNTFGDNYWMVDMEMDCSQSEEGWFEFKSYLNDQWESDITQDLCTGTIGGTAPYATTNHMGRCGAINTVQYAGNSCNIDSFTD